MSTRKLRVLAGSLAAAAMVGTLVLTVNAQSQPADEAASATQPAAATQPATQPAKQCQSASPQAMMQQCMGKMGKMGASQDMMDRMGVMMQTPIFMDDPGAVYGQADQLDLSDEQKNKLVEIQNEAREKSLAVLTDEQRTAVESAPSGGMAMMQMRQKMFGKMKMKPMMHGMGGQGAGQMPMSCPTCPGMTDGKPTEASGFSTTEGDGGKAVEPTD